MTSHPNDPADDLIEYIWSLARMCYVAQASLWKWEGQALEAQDSDLADRFRDYQIALYSSSVQINSAEQVVRGQTGRSDVLEAALIAAEKDAEAALQKLESFDTAGEGAEALIQTLGVLEAVSADL